MYRSSNVSMPGPGHYGHCDGSQGLLLGSMGPSLSNNTFTKNIVVSEAKERGQVDFVHVSHYGAGGFANSTRGSTFDSNLYFSVAFTDPKLWPKPTPFGTFEEWRAAGYGTHSKVGDPKFRDASSGDFRLAAGSAAVEIGFVPLPEGLDRC